MDPVEQAVRILRREIADRVRRIIGVAQTPESPSTQDIADIERLDNLLKVYERTRPAPPSRRVFVGTVFLVTAAVIALLLFVRVSKTDITVELQLSKADFRVTTDQILTEIVGASRITFSGIQRIQLPPGVPTVFDGTNLRTEVPSASLEAPGEIPVTLDPILVPGGTRVDIAQDEDGAISLSFLHDSNPLSVLLTVPPNVSLTAPGVNPSSVDLGLHRPRPIEIVSNPGLPLDISITRADTADSVFREELPIDFLSLERLVDEEGMRARRRSTILGGTLSLEALGKSIDLRRRDHLHVVLNRGTVSNLSITTDHIALLMTGNATEITVGHSGNARNLMPRLLEWLKAQNEIFLYWGATTYLFLLLLGVFRWWGAVK